MSPTRAAVPDVAVDRIQVSVKTSSDRQPAADPHLDLYRVNADLYGTLMRPIPHASRAALGDIIAGARPSDIAGARPSDIAGACPSDIAGARLSDMAMVDVGAGIGTALPVLAEAGSAPLYAVEPSTTCVPT